MSLRIAQITDCHLQACASTLWSPASVFCALNRLVAAVGYLATISSAVQFTCLQQEFKVQKELGPGLRLLTRTANGKLHTHIEGLVKR